MKYVQYVKVISVMFRFDDMTLCNIFLVEHSALTNCFRACRLLCALRSDHADRQMTAERHDTVGQIDQIFLIFMCVIYVVFSLGGVTGRMSNCLSGQNVVRIESRFDLACDFRVE